MQRTAASDRAVGARLFFPSTQFTHNLSGSQTDTGRDHCQARSSIAYVNFAPAADRAVLSRVNRSRGGALFS